MKRALHYEKSIKLRNEPYITKRALYFENSPISTDSAEPDRYRGSPYTESEEDERQALNGGGGFEGDDAASGEPGTCGEGVTRMGSGADSGTRKEPCITCKRAPYYL